MPFQTPTTIKRALTSVHTHEYVLPAIQREFVWRPEQIARLFDSLMLNYPIGSFLFWKVDRESVRKYRFYDFVLHYHQKDAPHCPVLEVPGDTGVTAVLDGQQRLTALNIGLRGSHAVKEPRKRWSNPAAFPTKRLYLNLLADADDNEEGMQYDFRFLTEARAQVRDENQFWFPVPKIMDMEAGSDLFEYLHDNDLTQSKSTYRTLDRLHTVVHKDGLIAYFLEESQDLDKVLNIFIRTNSGGTVLSYSDLLLSIATAQWDKLDARKEIHGLVDDLNNTRFGFSFSKDFVLKAGLMLADIGSVGFKVTNFNRQNMAILEDRWSGIARALRMAVQLAADFGFSGATLSSDSSLLPIAYYLYVTERSSSYLTAGGDAAVDRERIRGWLIRSLLKSGVWGSGVDTFLTALRDAIRQQGAGGFPISEIESVMVKRGKNPRFDEEEIEDLLDSRYQDRRTFALLSLLFPFLDLKNEFHVDHVFPRSRFSEAKLQKAGVSEADITAHRERVDRLANLQLLEGLVNMGKSAKLPLAWARDQFPDEDRRNGYLERHDLEGLPEQITSFLDFYDARRERLHARLQDVLSTSR